jgi:5-methylcytosine-specific restriction endonuclease McrA
MLTEPSRNETLYGTTRPRGQQGGQHSRYLHVTVDDLRRMLARPISPGARKYIRAEVDLKTEKKGLRRHIWLTTAEIKDALTGDLIVKCHQVSIAVVNVEHKARWQKLRKQIFQRYGRRCMRCGCSDADDRLELDHIKSWKEYRLLRYDPENLQVLCQFCNLWKKRVGNEKDFRPASARKKPSK